MVEIPESLLRRSAEAKAKALGAPVEQVLAADGAEGGDGTAPRGADDPPNEVARDETGATTLPNGADEPGSVPRSSIGNGRGASLVTPRRSVPPAGLPEGVRTQRLLTVVKARAIQNVKAEPADKVNTWPHLMLMEFAALLLLTGFLIVLAVIIQSPLLEPADFNATPNPSKAPWYFLGLQELLSYFDPQIAGVMVPLVVGFIGFMLIPYVDKNPSTRPTDRKLAIMLYSVFVAGSATLTIIGVLFRGTGFNWAYPWDDGIYFDDLKDWLDFE